MFLSYVQLNNMCLSYSKVRYYLLFFYYKLRVFLDCKSGCGRLYISELIHIWNSIFHTYYEMPGYDKIYEIETIFGKFKFIGDNYGYSILSPAFERPDKEFLTGMMRQTLRRKKSILFLDIGGLVGDYAIGISRLVKSNAITTLVFEPDHDYYKLLLTNARVNAVPKFKAYNIGLSNKNKTIRVPRFPTLVGIIPSKILTFRLRCLDDMLPESFYEKFDEIFVKIDIEGHEQETFEGAENLVKSGKKIRLMIEDCVNPSIIQYLSHHGWRFTKKITPYDSFWEIN